MARPPYFLIAVSTRENLALCKRHALAGFTSSINGAWTYSDIPLESRISFLYGARAHNLYIVREKFCIDGSDASIPWGSLTFRSGSTYNFPFRLKLQLLRKFEYPLTSDKFGYVAENLLLRGGYRKTHFQADSTDLGHASEIGESSDERAEPLQYSSLPFQLLFAPLETKKDPPRIFPLREIVLQSAIRNHLSREPQLSEFLEMVGVNSIEGSALEVLGEKALPRGYIDILLKEANPTGLSRKFLVEVKLKKASTQDFRQLRSYMDEFGKECLGGVVIARDFGRASNLPKEANIKCLTYSLQEMPDTFSFEELVSSIRLQPYGD